MSESLISLKIILPYKTFVYTSKVKINQLLRKIWVIIKQWSRTPQFGDKFKLCNFFGSICELTNSPECGWITEEIELNFDQEKLTFRTVDWTFNQVNKMSDPKSFVHCLVSI